MRRRLVMATMAAVTVALLLLGVPLAVAGGLLVVEDAHSEVRRRADLVARSVERRVQAEEDIDRDVLEQGVGARGPWPGRVTVTGSGTRLVVGRNLTGATYQDEVTTSSGHRVRVEVSQGEVNGRAAQVVASVVGLATAALLAAGALGAVQARRLAAPLVELASNAEQLGAGQARTRILATGVRELDQVAAELNRSADRVTQRLTAERQFTTLASHQLRTPLTALSMRLEEILDSDDIEAVRSEARVALDQVERLTTVVQDLLSRARFDVGTQVRVELRTLMTQQEQEWQAPFRAAGRDLVVAAPAGLFATVSPGGLSQVLATLVENSLVHGGGTTTMVARFSGRSTVIEVGDEGPGVPEHLGSRVFEQAVSSASSTGLGLALARDLVEADGGRLELLRHHPALFGVFLGESQSPGTSRQVAQ